jgi:hypothetical protein
LGDFDIFARTQVRSGTFYSRDERIGSNAKVKASRDRAVRDTVDKEDALAATWSI